MSRKLQKSIEKQLIDIVNNRVNDNKCGECSTPYPTWASYNLGIFLCGRCASIHRRILGPSKISKVKSLTLDSWTEDQVDDLRRMGNKRAKKKWNAKREPFPRDDDDDGPIEDYIRDKYIYGKFRNDSLSADDYGNGYSDDESYYGGRSRSNSGARSRSRSNSGPLGNRSRSSSMIANNAPVPRLSHRKLTTFESTQFQPQVSKVMAFGYSNRDAVQESLLLSNGSIDLALDILDQDAKFNPREQELPPELPKRPSTSRTASSQATVQSQPKPSTDDWWANSQPTTNNSTPSTSLGGVPQIYQYTDPVTGQISYIDSTGQEYLDPNNPEHQRLLYQQTNPQLVAQQTAKQNILSFYNQPNGGQQSQQQQQQQQQQLQPQQQQATGYLSSFQTPQQTGFPVQSQFQQPTGFQQGFAPQSTGFQPQQTGFNGAPLQQNQFTGFGQPGQPYAQPQFQSQFNRFQ